MSQIRYQVVDLARIREHPDNIRTWLTGIDALAASIKAVGLQVPLTVHQKFVPERGKQDLELIYGHRRLAALNAIGAPRAKVEIRPFMEPREALLMMLAERQRTDPDLEGIAAGVRKLKVRYGLDELQIAQKLGTTVAAVRAWLNAQQPTPAPPIGTPIPTPPRPDYAPARNVRTRRAPRAGHTQPRMSAKRIYAAVDDYDTGKITAEAAVDRMRGMLAGWRPS